MAKANHATRNKQLVRPTGLTEAIWACVLDDYLSEEEEGEINKVLGNHEKAPWYLNPDAVACTPTRNTTRRIHSSSHQQQDPRDPRERGGRDFDSLDEERDGTPGVWDETSSTAELPPVMWLSLPPDNKAAARKGGDCDVSTGDWDMALLSPRERNEILLQRPGSKHHSSKAGSSIHHSSSTKSVSARSRQSSKSNTFSPSMLSTPCGNNYAMAISRSGSQRSSPRSRSQAIVAELRRSRSKSQGKNRASRGDGKKKTTSDAREERQPQSRWMWGNHETRS